MPVGPDTQPMRAQGGGWLVGGRYEVAERLGAGGMAEVFRAHDRLLDRDVALKVFRTLVTDGVDEAADRRRERELQTLARLSHPNLVTLFDGAVVPGAPAYLVLELVPGADLATRLRDGCLAEPEVRLIGAQVAEALGYVHAHGLVHRDVKPANILLGRDLGPAGPVRARLSDFGIVRMIDAQHSTPAQLTVGTASYIAPEQVRGADVGPPADVYSLGLVLIEALTGSRCFDGPMHETLTARLSRQPSIPADLPEPWPTLLAAMTAVDPAQRPSAPEVAQALRTGSGSAPPIETRHADAVPAMPPLMVADDDEPVVIRHRGKWAGATLIALMAFALAAALAGASYILLGGNLTDPGGSHPAPPAQYRSVSPSAAHHRTSANVADVRRSRSAPSAVRRSHAASAISSGSSSQVVVAGPTSPPASSSPTSSAPSSPSSTSSATTPTPTPTTTPAPTGP